MSHPRQDRSIMKLNPSKRAPLHPEFLTGIKGSVVEPFKAPGVRYDDIPFENSDCIVPLERFRDVWVQKHVVEHDAGTFGVNVILNDGNGGGRCRDGHDMSTG